MSLEEHEEDIKSMESKIHFPGKGFDLSALIRVHPMGQ